MTDEEYIKKIESIPHLNLTPFLEKVPLVEICQELKNNIKNISKFDYSREIDEEKRKDLESIWQGFSLVDVTKFGAHMIDYYTTDSNYVKLKELGAELKEDGFAKFFITDIGQEMPITTKYTTSLFQNLCRIRVSKLSAGSIIHYHCHVVKSRKNLNKFVPDESYRSTIHIPIITNQKAYFVVTKNNEFSGHSDDFFREDHQDEFCQRYKLGEVWMFNSVHYHKAVNKGTSDRYHMLIYFDFMDEKIRPIIEQAVKAYKGPFII